ncbi:MAG: barstar family protein [Clostridia bacterium]|nr:barstar family protein [Clostridia bacterium]
MKKAIIDLTDCDDVFDLQERIKVGMDFPNWYGRNWSAFWDMINKETDVDFVIVKGSKTVSDDLNKSIEIMAEILERNKRYWGTGCPFDYEFID